MDLHNIREDYKFDSLLEANLQKNPFDQFKDWFESYQLLRVKDANAMAIATVDGNGIPQNRIVLLKEVRENGLVFYTNYASNKGQQLIKNPNISSLFFWREQERQIRITGTVSRLDEQENDKYFKTRPWLSQIGAAASEQSKPIDDRNALEEKFNTFQQHYPEGSTVPKPESWGGFLISPETFEFWQGRSGRLHDRILYTVKEEEWVTMRLQP
jgi:pyridoxamine 5'-phosphate oxidase